MSMEKLSSRRLVLRCRLGSLEILDRTAELVAKTQERELRARSLDDWKAEKKTEQNGYESEITHLEIECFKLAKVVETREEERKVDCEDRIDGATVVTIRLDTGEIVSTRPATSEEMQRELPIPGESA